MVGSATAVDATGNVAKVIGPNLFAGKTTVHAIDKILSPVKAPKKEEKKDDKPAEKKEEKKEEKKDDKAGRKLLQRAGAATDSKQAARDALVLAVSLD
jgi:hypothetical protein